MSEIYRKSNDGCDQQGKCEKTKIISKFSGSFNFGVIRQFGVPGICVDTHNKNILLVETELQTLISKIGLKCLSNMNIVVPRWKQHYLLHYNKHCGGIPCLKAQNEALPWNGVQINHEYASNLHNDATDCPGIPCCILFLGTSNATVRIYDGKVANTNYSDIVTKPGGLLLFDSTQHHEVLKNNNNNSNMPHSYIANRSSIVLMANKQMSKYSNPHIVNQTLAVFADLRNKINNNK